MLVTYQLPIADLRSFVDGPQFRLYSSLALFNPESEFIAGVGTIRSRRKGVGVPQSDRYVDLRSAVRFPENLDQISDDVPWGGGGWQGAFRRMYGFGKPLLRAQIALRSTRLSVLNQTADQITRSLASIPLRIRSLEGWTTVSLADSAAAIARSYATGTGKVGARSCKWWVQPANGLVILDDVIESQLPDHAELVAPLCSAEAKVWTWHGRVSASTFEVWAFATDNAVLRRQLRTHIGSIQAEREVLRATLRQLARGRLALDETEPGEALAHYLDSQFRVFSHRTRNGLPVSETMAKVYDSDRLVNPEERAVLMEELRKAPMQRKAHPPTKAIDQAPTSILALGANPLNTQQVRITDELRRISDVFDGKDARFNVNVVHSARLAEVNSKLSQHKPALLHLAVHGSHEGALSFSAENGFADEGDGDAIARLLLTYATFLKCVVMTSCYSADFCEAVTKSIPYAIGTEVALDDDTAVAFAKDFYTCVSNGDGIRASYERGLLAASVVLKENTAWQNIKLYVSDEEEARQGDLSLRPGTGQVPA